MNKFINVVGSQDSHYGKSKIQTWTGESVKESCNVAIIYIHIYIYVYTYVHTFFSSFIPWKYRETIFKNLMNPDFGF